MPEIMCVGEVGRLNGGVPFTISVKDSLRVGNAVPMDVRIINVRPTSQSLSAFEFAHPDTTFAIWLLLHGTQVPLTDYGKSVQPRHKVWGSFGGGPIECLEPGAVKSFEIDLRKIFQITDPGEYDVVVEELPVQKDKSEDSRNMESVKTSFTLLP